MKCLFCNFIDQKVTEHKNGYKFSVNYETQNTVSFLSLDSPVNNEAHLIIMPKMHVREFHKVPSRIKAELIEHVATIGRFYSAKGKGYNILLNNSETAGQNIMHTHFHVIPRKRNDGVKIEVWKRNGISAKDFTVLANKTRKEFVRSLKSRSK